MKVVSACMCQLSSIPMYDKRDGNPTTYAQPKPNIPNDLMNTLIKACHIREGLFPHTEPLNAVPTEEAKR